MGETKLENNPPQAPSTQSEVNSWVGALPSIYNAQMQYQLPMAQAQKSAMEQLYPTTSGLQENLANQAVQGIGSNVPDWMRQQYQSNTNAQLGANAGSPIGADYMSRGLLQQQQDWKQYYQNLALSAAGRQPLAGPSLDYMSNFTPGQVMQGMNQNFGTQGSIYGQQLQNQGNNPMMNLIGGIGGSAAGGASAALMAGALHI